MTPTYEFLSGIFVGMTIMYLYKLILLEIVEKKNKK